MMRGLLPILVRASWRRAERGGGRVREFRYSPAREMAGREHGGVIVAALERVRKPSRFLKF